MAKLRIIILLWCFVQADLFDIGSKKGGTEYVPSTFMCASCISQSTSCISEDFRDAMCCEYDAYDPVQAKKLKNCKSRYKYCSTGLRSNLYTSLVCPSTSCPGVQPVTFQHKDFYDYHYVSLKWNLFKYGNNCKIKISADKGMNGKLQVQILHVEKVNLFVYLQPNSFNSKYGTQGILENNKIYSRVDAGVYTVPTDWNIILQYNPGVYPGQISMKSWVEEYDKKDMWYIENDWQPTGTFFVDVEGIQREDILLLRKRLHLQEMEKRQYHGIAQIDVNEAMNNGTLIYPAPEGLYFNTEIFLLIIGVGISLFMLGFSTSIFMYRKYRKRRRELKKTIQEMEIRNVRQEAHLDFMSNLTGVASRTDPL